MKVYHKVNYYTILISQTYFKIVLQKEFLKFETMTAL